MLSRHWISAWICAVAASALALAQPNSTTLRFAPANATWPSSIRVTVGNTSLNVPLPPLASATLKRDLVHGALVAAGHQVVNAAPGGDSLTILNTAPGRVMVETLNSGERADTIVAPAAPAGLIGFDRVIFEPWDPSAQPAQFTAGIITDVGELTTRVNALELNFMTDGPMICQALFQRLAPRAPHFGAVLNYSGDRLEVYFDPTYTIVQGGVVFGTTSRTPGCRGALDGPGSLCNVIIRSGPSLAPTIQTEIISLELQSASPIIPVPIPPSAPPPAVNQAVREALNSAGVPTLPGPAPDETRIFGFDCGNGSVRVETGGTAQEGVSLRAARASSAQVAYIGRFDPFSPVGPPAVFTAGIITDVGMLTEQISAQELNFQTEGPIICQALFQRLAPRAPQYGAQISYAGDRLEIYFDPVYTITQGGVVFGTTSPSRGAQGQLTLAARQICRADINGDGIVDFNDLLEFLNLYNSSDPRADWNRDGVVDFNDLLEYLNDYNRGCP